MPALLTRMSSWPPSASTASATARRTASSSVTSATTLIRASPSAGAGRARSSTAAPAPGGGRQLGGGHPEAGRPAGDQRGQPGELACLCFGTLLAHTVPPARFG